MKKTVSLLVMLVMVFCSFNLAAAKPLQVEKIGSFFVGGTTVTLSGLPTTEGVFAKNGPKRVSDPNGEFAVGQMYVQYIKLADSKAKYPLMLWHGGASTGATWETLIDGRPGWQTFFLKAGHDVYVSDAVERGRAGWNRWPEIYKTAPEFPDAKRAWVGSRIGPTYDPDPTKRVAFPGSRYPAKYFEYGRKAAVPRWSSLNDERVQCAYDEYVKKVGDCVILTTSQGGNFATQEALNNPDKVKAVILVEPSGTADPTADLTVLKNIPHLVIYGDYIQGHPTWEKYYANVSKYRDALVAAGVPVTWIDLPKIGIKGNSHALIQENNSEQIAQIIQDWMEKNKLMK